MNKQPLIAAALSLSALFVSFNTQAHSHAHPQSEKAIQASKGIFNDVDVKDRKLSDWDGIWESIYPLLITGKLDPVLEHKAKNNKDKTVDEYRAYYKKGYQTDVENISIENNIIEFTQNGQISRCEYHYSGFKILHYTSGKKGVRYLFECQDKHSKAPKYIQFSDHIIEPQASGHFHLYMGNESHEKLLQQMDNWPTYYPYSLNDEQIVHEMLHH
ncbi:TPA: metal-binding protein ZinT [Providencia stuartii]|uniref:Metal-binding protein ZinT n=3 Tax=Providencia stuartii TaxID=588 RepID=A0AAJ1JLQ9_PROST|nr:MULTISPECIES: metal-binding protein ZinT [Providencia]AFH95768.1 zinc/cadmium-binding protein [Providencia stuartii MRSN 2154]AIN63809.1 metal-binding protein ZinT [Providencia stuartii]APG49768.1 metal-binding protein ZinT [Providencia stuartii]AVE43216.1 metal-binding protein ZinT [Providencia stuartii]AVL40436.1 metal-binding protein ZinT [Providencia stuartii]